MMRLYSGTVCPFSQRCRIVLFEKGMDFEIIDIDLYNKLAAVSQMNPYGRVPILVERDLVLYESIIINEYVDERFPHPQLMPADPVMRARARLLLYVFEQEMFQSLGLLTKKDAQADAVRRSISSELIEMAPIFSKNKYILGDDFSMLDVAIAPLLWRLEYFGITLGKEASAVMKYAERIFSRPGFIEALTPQEKVMRK